MNSASCGEGRAGGLYLASGSPRRVELMRQAGYHFQQLDPPFDDTGMNLDGIDPASAALAMALLKGGSVLPKIAAGLVIGCDTVLDLDGRAVGKPSDESQARRMVGELMERWHEVVTGLAVLEAGGCGRRVLTVERTRVWIGRIERTDFDAYIQSGGWRGKAGGYNLAELEDRWPIRLEGDASNVVGLPMDRLREAIEQLDAGWLPRT